MKQLIKVAEKKYPISRAYKTLQNVGTLGLSGWVSNRALQGRVNMGQEGMGKSEKEVMSKMKKEDNGKTYPISRLLTNPGASAAIAGTSSALAGSQSYFGGGTAKEQALSAAAGGIFGAGLGYLSGKLIRATDARSLKGRAAKDREGWGHREQGILKQLKK